MEKLASLTQVEQDILKIAEDIINKDKVLNINSLHRTAKLQLNYPDEELSQALYSLLLKKLIFPGKKLTISNILNNDKRKQILDYIKENPGAHLREIREQLSLNPRVANWHLKVLENFELIYRKNYLNYRVFFPSNFEHGFEEPLLSLKNDNAINLFTTIYNHPELDLEQLKKIVNFSPNVTQYHLKRLISSGIILPYEEDGKEFFNTSAEKLDTIQKYFNINLKEEKIEKIPIQHPILEEISETIESIKEKPLKPSHKPKNVLSPKPISFKELTKPSPPTVQETSNLIDVKREYDYVGGAIRFKIAVQNISNTVITDINTTLIPTSQYEISERVKIVNTLKPGESRGIDFELIPLTCGKSNVFGTVTFFDPFGNPHTATIPPKEIWIKCPLVIPKKSTISEIKQLQKKLQKGTAKIPFKISENSAFKIVIDQISALDLSEIVVDDVKLLALYSGIAKVTNDNMIIESKIMDHDAILTIWTKDMKQATGFLAYLKNLIKIAFESALKMEDMTEIISQKILDSDEIIQRFVTLFDYCEGKWNIGDILILLKEIKTKIERNFSGLSLIDKMQDFIEDFEKNYKEGVNISEKNSINLEFQILEWLSEIYRIACNNFETYQQTFPDQKNQIDQLCKLIEEKDPLFTELGNKYTNEILQYLMIIKKDSGLTIYEHNFTEVSIDPDLIGGFLTAIQSFGSELSNEETSMTKLAYKNFEIALDDEENTRAALILKGKPVENLTKKLKNFIKEFELKFKKELKNWTGDVVLFEPADEILKKIFD